MPPTHLRCTSDQMLRADKQLRNKLVQLCRDGIIPGRTGARPLDVAIPKARKERSVDVLLSPLPSPPGQHARLTTFVLDAILIPIPDAAAAKRASNKATKVLKAAKMPAAKAAVAKASSTSGGKKIYHLLLQMAAALKEITPAASRAASLLQSESAPGPCVTSYYRISLEFCISTCF